MMLSLDGRKNTNCFVIFCMPRTGSYHLVSLLQSAYDIYCLGEIFKPNSLEVPAYDRKRTTARTISERNAYPLSYISELRQLHMFRHFGFKLFHDHVQRVPPLSHYLREPAVKRIVLFRNPLTQYASLAEAKVTGRWTSRKNGQSRVAKDRVDSIVHPHQAQQNVTFDPKQFSAFASSYNDYIVALMNFVDDGNTCFVSYEEINDTLVQARFLNHIGSQTHPEDLSTDLVKQNDKPLEQRIHNFEEMIDFIRRHKPFRTPPEPIYSKLGDLHLETIGAFGSNSV